MPCVDYNVEKQALMHTERLWKPMQTFGGQVGCIDIFKTNFTSMNLSIRYAWLHIYVKNGKLECPSVENLWFMPTREYCAAIEKEAELYVLTMKEIQDRLKGKKVQNSII